MPDKHNTVTIGVLADTHIPDRSKALPQNILSRLKELNIDRIFHAGDASCWKVIRALEVIAPVTIVQGNRDWFFGMDTPRHITLSINGIRITLTHGHRSMIHYLYDKWIYILRGYAFERYYQHLSQDFPDSDVIVFGHTHYQAVHWVDGKLYFNPGAAYPCKHNHFNPQFGVLRITPDGKICTESHNLY